MSDVFIRRKLNVLTGLTKYTQVKSVSPITLSAGTDPTIDAHWTDLSPEGVVTDTQYQYRLIAYQLTLDPGGGNLANPLFRILAENTGTILTSAQKVFPFPDYVNILSGTDEYLQYQLHVPPHYDFKLQVYAEFTTGVPTVNLDYLSIIRTDQYSNS